MQAFARALIFRAPGLFAPHACAARVSIVPRRLTRDLTANAGGWSIGPGGRVGGTGGGGGRERDERDDGLRRNRWGDEYEDDGRDRGGYDAPARGADRRAGPVRGGGGGRRRGQDDDPRRAEAPRRRGESSTRGRGGGGRGGARGRGRGRDDLRERPSRDRFDDRRFDDGPLIVPPKDTRQVPSRRRSSAPSRGRGPARRGGRGDGYDRDDGYDRGDRYDRGGYDPRDRAPPRRRGGYDRDSPVRTRSSPSDPRHDPFAGGPRPTPGHHDPGYDYRDHAPPERTKERGPRSTGIADAYYAAYLRGEVDLADPPQLDVYPRDEPDFNPIGPRWQMPDGTWFGEGPPDPRRTFDKEAWEKKVYWGTKEELMREERVAIGLEEPYVHPDDVVVKLISRPEGYWTITAKDEREGKPGTFTATPEVAEKVRRAMEEGDESPTWASTSPNAKGDYSGKDDEKNEEAIFERPRRASSSTALGDYYATCHPGLEDVVAKELESELIGASDVRVGASGVSFRGDARVGYRANVWLRCAIRVLCELDRGYIDPNVPGGAAIYDFVRDAAPWHEVIPADDGLTFSVESRVRSCTDVTSTRLASTRAKDAICDALVDVNGWRPPPPQFGHSSADVPLYLSLFRDEAKLYRDMSGESLHRRGYRDAAIHRAALNEAAAAGVLSLAGWSAACDRARERGLVLPALVDPMCGSGTLLIEGAMMAGRVAPGLIRVDAAGGFGKGGDGGRDPSPGVQRPAFAFERWPDHDPTLLEEVLEEAAEIGAAARKKMGGAPVIIGNDVHAGALSLARRAAMAAGVDGIIDFVQGDAAHLTHPKLTEFTAAALERDGLKRDVDEPVDLDDLGPTALRAEGGGVLVVSNPPWGMRIGARDDGYDGDDAGDGYGDGNWDDAASDAGSVRGGESVPSAGTLRAPDVEEAWQSLGAFFRRECGGATAHLLSGDANATRPLRMRARRKRVLGIGGVDCRLLEYRILPPRRRASLEELADAAREEEE